MNKSLLIIGAGTGLRRAVAERFAAEGFTISLISRNAANLEKVKAGLGESRRSKLVPTFWIQH
ncbi:short chain dehydrogenase [Dyadobacter sp. SG02]|uniref:SDR family NAD(P)-dependent oxidoreductase n=1 Tax=Dyadobacter sp. SG02 TaxID=1855291 RepID=UPI0008D825F5|nr:SDR family NAD(P)-dependent oxidoreductase [Dyadobacter sp. SG02]SEJ37279.1 short chain dehydrogenase [Dyadobacter sp. SG02]